MFRFTNLIIFELTRDCNLRCSYCFVKDKDSFKGEVIDFELYKKIIDRIVYQRVVNNYRNVIMTVVFHGGECTLIGKEMFSKCAGYIINAFKKNSLPIILSMQTNGTLLDEDWMDIITHFGIVPSISLDSFAEKNPQRFTSETRDNLLNALEMFPKNFVSYSLLSVISKQNCKNIVDEISQTNSVSNTRKINYLEDVYNPLNSKIELSGSEMFSEYYEKLFNLFLEKGFLASKDAFFYIKDSINDILFNNYYIPRGGCDGKICGTSINMIAVKPDGIVPLCDRYTQNYSDIIVGHALDYDFLGVQQLKKTIQMAKIKHDIVNEIGCDNCEAEIICTYGCQSMYYSKFGKYGIQKEVVCDKFIKVHQWVKKNLVNIFNRIILNNEEYEESEFKDGALVWGHNECVNGVLFRIRSENLKNKSKSQSLLSTINNDVIDYLKENNIGLKIEEDNLLLEEEGESYFIEPYRIR